MALAKLLKEVLRQEEVEADQLWGVTAKELYKSWMSIPPHSKIEQKLADFHFNRTRIWSRLSWVGLPPRAVDIAFRAINNVLDSSMPEVWSSDRGHTSFFHRLHKGAGSLGRPGPKGCPGSGQGGWR